jgi:hypothetical protein
MKKTSLNSILFFLFAISVLSYFIFANDPVEFIPENEKPVWAVSLLTAKEFKDKYELQFAGLGQSRDGDSLKTLRLSFILDKILTKEEGRELVLTCVNKLQRNINDFKNIQSLIKDPPFLEKNLGITILFYKDQNHSPTIFPDVCCITLIDGIIFYRYRDPNPPFLYKLSEEETIEEARKLINEDQNTLDELFFLGI